MSADGVARRRDHRRHPYQQILTEVVEGARTRLKRMVSRKILTVDVR
jgi:hypothetical protein